MKLYSGVLQLTIPLNNLVELPRHKGGVHKQKQILYLINEI